LVFREKYQIIMLKELSDNDEMIDIETGYIELPHSFNDLDSL